MALLSAHFLGLSSPIITGIRGRCPRCGQGKLFTSLLTLAPCCDECGLDYGFADPADGPAFFVMSITSFVSVAVMYVLQVKVPMPDWLLFAVTAALIVAMSIALLVPFKGWLVNAQYFNKAGEGVLAEPVSSAPCQCANCVALSEKRARKRKR
jgi:uncharacterized protein (DUF983 family)